MKIVYALVVAALVAGCTNKASEASNKETPGPDSVNVFILKMDSVKKDLSLPAELAPNENANIRAKVPGYIQKVYVDIGSKVRKGQLLALIDAPEINSRIGELDEKVKSAEARYQSSKDYYDRINSASKAEGAIAPSELQRTQDQMLADESEYKAALYSAASYRQMGKYLAIVAPYNGIITKRNIDPGSYVGDSNEQPLFEIPDNSTIRLRVAIPEIYSGSVLRDNMAELTTRSLPDKKFRAKLVRKAGSIDNATRSEIWEFEVSNENHVLKPGGYADVKLHFLRSSSSLIVPTSAIVTTLERKFVIKIDSGATRWRDVRQGFNLGDKQEVFGDLQAGDTIVLKGNEEIKPGLKLIPKLPGNTN
jgi:RND family efflux transporter MFP subunit